MTANRKAKAAARELAAETGRSYTHAKRAESAGTAPAAETAAAPVELLPHVPSTFPGPGTCSYCGRWYPLGQENEGCPERPAKTEPAIIRRFPADAELLVDAHFESRPGPETWTGERWNAFADSCEDPVIGGPFTIELLEILSRGTEPTPPARAVGESDQCPACQGACYFDTDEGTIDCQLCDGTGSVIVPPGEPLGGHEFAYESESDLFRCTKCRRYATAARAEDGTLAPCAGTAAADLAELHRQALALGELLEQADAQLLGIYGQAARRLAQLGDAAAFYAGARELAQDVDDLRATPNGHKCEALYRWRENPVEAAHTLARHARMVALDRCEVDEKDRPCSGSRSLSLAVWTVDGLSETWSELCVQHLVDYAERWDPRYAELVIGGEYHAAREAFAALHSRRPGEHNARIAGQGEDQYGRRHAPVPAPSPDAETCRFCGGAIEPGDEHEC